MQLIAKYSFGNRSAEVYQVNQNLYTVEYFDSSKLVNKTTHATLDTAKFIADNYTAPTGNNQQLLNENA
jgi:hypothetical protein